MAMANRRKTRNRCAAIAVPPRVAAWFGIAICRDREGIVQLKPSVEELLKVTRRMCD